MYIHINIPSLPETPSQPNPNARSKPASASPSAQPLPQCQEKPFGSDAYWRCFVLHMATTFYHFGGTCKMGPESDPYSVLDEKLR